MADQAAADMRALLSDLDAQEVRLRGERPETPEERHSYREAMAAIRQRRSETALLLRRHTKTGEYAEPQGDPS